MKTNAHALGLLFFGALLGSCASAPPMRKPLFRAEAVRMDREMGPPLALKLEETLTLVHSPDVTIYLREVADHLMKGVPDLAESPVGVFLFRESGKEWRTYSVPGARIYLPTSVFHLFEYEGEAAAMLSLELANLTYRLVVQKVEKAMGPDLPLTSKNIEVFIDFPGFKSLFALSATEFLRSVEKATSILYQGGFDPRGMVSYLEILIAHPERSTQDVETLREGILRARRVIVSFAPILSPVIRSERFLAVQKRFGTL